MAVIDFKCQACGAKFFEIVSSSNRDKVQCPQCGSKEVKQVFEGKCSLGSGGKGGGGCSSGNCGGCSSGNCGGCSGCH